jgi:acetyl esterase/lipase
MSDPVLRDVVFAEHPGFRPVTLDLHPPEVDRPAPVVLQLHGGGWLGGRRSVFTPLVGPEDSFGRIAAAGFAVVAADYRLSGEAVFPAQVDDVMAALDWIGTHADQHRLDPERIVLWGGSAGGTLAALAGLRRPPGVRGVIDWYGPSDQLAMAAHTVGRDAVGQSREDRWLGAPVASVPDRAREASPALRVTAGAPPFHLAHGDADDDVPLDQSTRLATALHDARVNVEYVVEPGLGHFWRGAGPTRTAEIFDRAIAFARRVTGTPTTGSST